jgi:competence protein ComEA
VRELLGDEARDTDPRDTEDLERGGRRAPGGGGGAATRSAGHGRPSWWHRLAARLPVRVDPGRRTAVIAGVAALVVAIITGAWVLADRPQAVTVDSARAASPHAVPGSALASGSATAPSAAAPASGTSAPATADAAPSASAAVVVDVAGKVRRPGVFSLPAGSRIGDAVRAAGGALPRTNLNSLNLAAKVVDGEQIPVGIPAAAGASVPAAGTGGGAGGGSGGGSGGTATAATPVNLNTATAEALQTLPGVGPVLSQNILDWRAAHGTFHSVDQLNDVTGIGTVKFAALRPLVTV